MADTHFSGSVDCAGFKVSSTTVVTSQQTAVDDATDAATAITSLNSVIDALEAHGLLAPNGA